MPQNTIDDAVRARVISLGTMTAVMWIIVILDYALPPENRLSNYGIHPRTVRGVVGIFTAPFLHAGIKHITANTIPFLVMGTIISFRGIRLFFVVFAASAGIGGSGVWFIGRDHTNHIGASGVIFSFLLFIIIAALWERPINITQLLLAGITAFFYLGILWGVFPSDPHTSWEGHLCGAVAGIIVASGFIVWKQRKPEGEGFESVATLEAPTPVSSQPVTLASQAPPVAAQTTNPFDAPPLIQPQTTRAVSGPMTVTPVPPPPAGDGRQWTI